MNPLWPLRRKFWNGLALVKYRGNKPAKIPPVPPDEQRLSVVPLAQRIPAIPIHRIVCADRIPDDEADRKKAAFYRFQTAMYRWFPAMQDGLAPIDADPMTALRQAYTGGRRKSFPAPVLPAELAPVDLGRLAVASPFACFVERGADGRFRWDLELLDAFELHPGLVSLGSSCIFAVDDEARVLRPVEIRSALGTSNPGDADWDRAQQLVLCAATNYLTMGRHYSWIHLIAGSGLAIATRNCLPADHPLRRLLWPHIYGTQFSNHITTLGQMLPGGDFASIFSFTHSGMCELFDDSYERFDITVIDPRRDAARRGIVGAGFDTPALDNYVAHFDVMRTHALRYLRTYYASDEALALDEAVVAWIGELESLLPGGVRPLLGEHITVDAVADLVGAFIYMTTVQHEILGTGMWNYQMWTDVQPVRIYENGQREPVDVYQRLVNANLLLNVRRAPLLEDVSYLALEDGGRAAFAAFQTDLLELQHALDREPSSCWKIEPKILEANINA